VSELDVRIEPEVNERAAISVVLPAYNEEAGIGAVLDNLCVLPGKSGFECEFIVVDDGSSDRTAEIVRQYPNVAIIQHTMNRGYGAALKTGIRHAKHEVICIADADGTYPNEAVPNLVGHLMEGDYDMVVGARTGTEVSVPFMRRPAKWALGKLANLVVGESIPDINSGLRVFKRSVALRFLDLLPNGFSFTTTITLGMLANGYLVDHVPINYFPRIGKSKIRPIQDTLSFIQLILRIALYFAPLKIFLPLSGMLMLLAMGWGGFSWFFLGQLADVSTLVIVLAAIQVAAVGLLAELINHRLVNIYRRE
jgi:glycosyltransferase involved in cell wall biosynthesis